MSLIQMKAIAVVIVLLAASAPAFAQKNDDWWKMSDQKPDPRRSADDAAVNAIKWTFPAPGQVLVEIDGKKFYQLTPEIFGTRTMVGEDKNVEAAAVLFTPKMIAIVQLAQINNPADIPDLDRFLIWSAVHLAVEDPSNKGFHRYLGTATMLGMPFHFYELRSGQYVAANISTDHRTVLIMPGPTK